MRNIKMTKQIDKNKIIRGLKNQIVRLNCALNNEVNTGNNEDNMNHYQGAINVLGLFINRIKQGDFDAKAD